VSPPETPAASAEHAAPDGLRVASGARNGVPTSAPNDNKDEWRSYKVPYSKDVKANLVAKYRLGGIMAWTLGMEDAATMPSVRIFAQSIAPDQVVATLLSDKNSTTYGDPIKVQLQFTLPDKQPIPNLPLNIEAKNSDGTWRKIYVGNTTIDGTLVISALLGGNSILRATSESSWERVAGLSKDLNIEYKRKISLAAPASVARGKEVIISGLLQPKESGVKITLERLAGDSYKEVTLKNPVITDLDGRFTLSFIELNDGFTTFRIKSAATPLSALGVSENFIISIR
jgi:hypothetical protein